jgi:hypothetical protein
VICGNWHVPWKPGAEGEKGLLLLGAGEPCQ